MNHTVHDLEHSLREPDLLGTGPDLEAIRREGTTRRRARRAGLAATGAVAVAVVTGAGYGVTALVTEPASVPVATQPAAVPTEPSPLAARTLREIPGTAQVSAYQVVVPRPDSRLAQWPALDPGTVSNAVRVDAHAYTGVTMFPPSAFPDWLWNGVSNGEQSHAEPDGSYSVGSAFEGINVDLGPAYVGCTAHEEQQGCSVSLMHRWNGRTYLEWGMGTETFLEPGAPMELFTSDDYSTGAPTTLWIGGIDGTEVASVDYVLADGSVVEGEVAAGTISEGDSIFWANVPGRLAEVVARDAAGEVVEHHEVQPCTDPVDCEVR